MSCENKLCNRKVSYLRKKCRECEQLGSDDSNCSKCKDSKSQSSQLVSKNSSSFNNTSLSKVKEIENQWSDYQKRMQTKQKVQVNSLSLSETNGDPDFETSQHTYDQYSQKTTEHKEKEPQTARFKKSKEEKENKFTMPSLEKNTSIAEEK